jgi:hypothetical protein
VAKIAPNISEDMSLRSEVTQKRSARFQLLRESLCEGCRWKGIFRHTRSLDEGMQRERAGLLRSLLCVLAKNAEYLALNADVGRRGVDGRHFGIGGLETDHAAFAVEALKGGIGAVDEGDDDLAFAGGAGALDQDVVSGDDVLVAHGVAANFKGEDLAIADDIAEGDAFGGFDGLNRPAGCDAAEEGEAIRSLFAAAGGKYVDRAAAVVGALKQPFVLQVGDVFVHGGKRAEAKAAGDLLVGGRVAVLLSEVGEEVDDLFLPSRYCHADDCSE